MAIVEFDVTAFRSAYPQFDTLTDAQLQEYFNLACLLLDNTDNSIVTDISERTTLLNLLVAHLGTLNERGGSATGAVASASEGSVSTSFMVRDWGSGAWFAQTQYGLLYWQLTLKYRLGGRWYRYFKH